MSPVENGRGPGQSGRRRRLAPPHSAQRAQPFRARSSERLAPFVPKLMLEAAEVLSEGDVQGEKSEATFFGTTMLTIDLRPLSEVLRIDAEADGARLAAFLKCSSGFRVHAVRIARREAERRLEGRLPGKMLAELSFRCRDTRIFVDIDVELALDSASECRTTRSVST